MRCITQGILDAATGRKEKPNELKGATCSIQRKARRQIEAELL
jgi:hypothetical protein